MLKGRTYYLVEADNYINALPIVKKFYNYENAVLFMIEKRCEGYDCKLVKQYEEKNF